MPQEASSTQTNSPSRLVDGRRKAANDPCSAYSAALDYLYSRIDYERIGHAPYSSNHYRLDRMKRLLSLVGNPHNSYSIVHVAGTKGKGTVAKLISDGLAACGFRCGLYTSPHLERLEERFQFGGREISPGQLIALVRRVRSAADQLETQGGGRATFFELTTAIGMLFFADQSAECAVLEVGLGGRLDSTNVCSPIVSVITSISLDHQRQLGNTLAEIAAEKAGVIKGATPVVCSARDPDVRQVIFDQAKAEKAPLYLIDRDFSVAWQRIPGKASSYQTEERGMPAIGSVAEVEYRPSKKMSSSLGRSTWPTCMLGSFQADNIAAALAALDVMAKLGWKLSQDKLRTTLARSAPPARMQVFATDPIRIIDTAHNVASMTAGLNALEEHFPQRAVNILFASSSDKDYRAMLKQLIPRCRKLVITAYKNNPRALPARELAETARAIARAHEGSCPVHMVESPNDAWQIACGLTGPDQLLYATGSFYLAAELLAINDGLASAKQ